MCGICYTKSIVFFAASDAACGEIMGETTFEQLHASIKPQKDPDKAFFLDLLDEPKQRAYEETRVRTVMLLLKVCYINKCKLKIKAAQEAIAQLRGGDFSAENYREIIAYNAQIRAWREEIEGYKVFFTEPYFARMDLSDPIDGYNSYYIGKRGDVNLEIVDWRAPLARKYYQKSQIRFSINEYEYKLVLRRALRTANGKFIDYKNEYLSVRDYLTKEEIAGRDEEIIFDPYLKEILKTRKEQSAISDIIETIQEQQYEVITKPERDSFVLQGCAGSGKTMIMLHRLSFLLYNNEDLRPRDVLVITPSNSFNAFIDELSQVLELEKIRTTTIDEYFLQVLANAGIELDGKAILSARPPEAYARYIYSEEFSRDTEERLRKIYDGVSGMFLSRECRQAIEAAVECFGEQSALFAAIRNASTRVRRAVLGEIKERTEGGLYYTKPFRELMNEASAAEEFLSGCLVGKYAESYAAFYRGLFSFYKAGSFLVKAHAAVTDAALGDLAALSAAVEKEIADLRRYKIVRGGVEVETYAERISRRSQLLEEIASVSRRVETIASLFSGFCELFETLRGDRYFSRIGKCGTHTEFARLFYKETVRKAKNAFGMGKGMYRCDAYALCMILQQLGCRLQPRYALVFVDEGQDLSAGEYRLLKGINPDAAFNIYGDLAQNMTPFRGITDWNSVPGEDVYTLDCNYRNTNQIVAFVAQRLHIPMRSIGFDGPAVARIGARGISSFFRDKKGLKAIIVSEEEVERYRRKSYNVLADTGRISKKKINLMSVYESKGLEFTCVAVVHGRMTDHEKYIAYTRALKELAVVEERGE